MPLGLCSEVYTFATKDVSMTTPFPLSRTTKTPQGQTLRLITPKRKLAGLQCVHVQPDAPATAHACECALITVTGSMT